MMEKRSHSGTRSSVIRSTVGKVLSEGRRKRRKKKALEKGSERKRRSGIAATKKRK